MKQLLAKIQSASSDQKCQLALEVYGHVTMVLQSLEKQLEKTAPSDHSTADIAAMDHSLDEIEAILDTIENFLNELDPEKIKRIQENIERDYAETLKLWTFYEILNPDGKTYTADYDGRAEAGSHGQNSPAGPDFTGHKFAIPTLQEILARLSPAQMKLYQQMKRQGLKPKLQLTPIALNIHTLAQKIDAKRAKLKINNNDTYVREDIKDSELQYAPTSIKAIKGGKEIEIIGGQTKSTWIKQNQGVLVDLVPTKQYLGADSSIQTDPQSNAAQAEKYAAKIKRQGFTPMSYESYLLAQMRAVKAAKPLEDWRQSKTSSLLLDSSLKDTQCLTYGFWVGGCISLNRGSTSDANDFLRLRSTVRLK